MRVICENYMYFKSNMAQSQSESTAYWAGLSALYDFFFLIVIIAASVFV